jgi:uncharacterized SAM-binding protein YcdF (DUF218 family)
MSDVNNIEILRAYLEILIDGPDLQKGNPQETAILLLPGKYQKYRITQGVKLWPSQGNWLWIAGTRGDPIYSKKDIISVIGKDSPDVVCQGFAKHTLDQMEWCAALLKQNPHIKHLIITTAAYHLPRCVLTLLQVLTKAEVRIPITPFPLKNPSGDSFSVEGGEDFISEIQKIGEYQQKGDVLSLDVWKEYLSWRISDSLEF